MHDASSTRRYARSIMAVLALLAGAFQAHGTDTYGPGPNELQVPSLGIGNATYSNVVVTIGSIVTAPSGTSPNATQDSYNPTNNLLTVPAVELDGTTYYNAVVTVAQLTSIGGVSGADTYNGTNLTISCVQLDQTAYFNVVVAVTLKDVIAVHGGMPLDACDQYDPSTHQLTIPAVQFGSKVYTNVVLNVGLSQVLSVGTPPAGAFTVGGTVSGLATGAQVTLEYNNEYALTLAENGPFEFATLIATGGSYSVTIATQPGNGEVCSIINGSGANVTANVNNLTVNCAAALESVLYSFGATRVDGIYPQGNLIQANDGNFYGMTPVGGANNRGAVIKVTPAGDESVLYSFGAFPGDGLTPRGSLIQASDGNFYGMTEQGGVNGGCNSNCGTVFRITFTGTESVLYSFAGLGDGATPYGSLIQASDGNLYGMTSSGGLGGVGTVFRITLTGSESVMHWFGAFSGDGKQPQDSLIQASDGNFYGMTVGGGTPSAQCGQFGCGTVFKITSAGDESVLHSFGSAPGDGANPFGSLIQASDGNLYGMTELGGAHTAGFGEGAVIKVTLGGAESVLYSFGSIAGDGRTPVGSLIQASDRNFYGMTYAGGASTNCGGGCGTVFVIMPTGSETVLHSFGSAFDGEFPEGSLIQATDGNLYGMTSQGGANGTGAVIKIK